MIKSLRLRLGKKDQLIKNWWDLLVSEGENVSATITYCIAYYIKTGSFLEIAKLPNNIEGFKDIVKKVYMSEKSITYLWIMEKQEQGEKYGTIIKRILRNSIKESTDGSCYFKSLDEIIMAVERLERNVSVNVIAEVQGKGSFVEVAETQSYIKREEPAEGNMADETIISYEEDDDESQEEIDLYGLIGHQLELG